MINSLNISAFGMQTAQLRLNEASHHIAAQPAYAQDFQALVAKYDESMQTPALDDQQTLATLQSHDLVSEILNLHLAKHSIEANLKAAQAADSALGSIIDMVDSRDRN